VKIQNNFRITELGPDRGNKTLEGKKTEM